MEDAGGILGGELSGRYGDSLNRREEQERLPTRWGEDSSGSCRNVGQDEAKEVYTR